MPSRGKIHRARDFLWEKQKGKCAHCGKLCIFPGQYGDRQDIFTVDHIIPKMLIKSDTADNLQGLCAKCNSKKGCRLSVD